MKSAKLMQIITKSKYSKVCIITTGAVVAMLVIGGLGYHNYQTNKYNEISVASAKKAKVAKALKVATKKTEAKDIAISKAIAASVTAATVPATSATPSATASTATTKAATTTATATQQSSAVKASTSVSQQSKAVATQPKSVAPAAPKASTPAPVVTASLPSPAQLEAKYSYLNERSANDYSSAIYTQLDTIWETFSSNHNVSSADSAMNAIRLSINNGLYTNIRVDRGGCGSSILRPGMSDLDMGTAIADARPSGGMYFKFTIVSNGDGTDTAYAIGADIAAD